MEKKLSPEESSSSLVNTTNFIGDLLVFDLVCLMELTSAKKNLSELKILQNCISI